MTKQPMRASRAYRPVRTKTWARSPVNTRSRTWRMEAKSQSAGFQAGSAVRRIGSMPPKATARIAYAGTTNRASSQIVPGAAIAAQNVARARLSSMADRSGSGVASVSAVTGRPGSSAGGELRPLVLPDLVGFDRKWLEAQALGDDVVRQHGGPQVLGDVPLGDEVLGVEPSDRREVAEPREVELGVGRIEHMVDVEMGEHRALGSGDDREAVIVDDPDAIARVPPSEHRRVSALGQVVVCACQHVAAPRVGDVGDAFRDV